MSTFRPPAFMRQQSKQLMINLKKDISETDDLGELDITSILRSDIDDEHISQQDQDLIKDALKKGLDLRQYTKEVEDSLNELDKGTIADYFRERDNFLELYSHIEVVDGVLCSLEKMLNDYHNDLKNVGAEMNSLQERSMSMNYQLNNRKLTKEKLYEFIDVVTIAPEFSNHLLKGDINEEYISCLSKLDTKITLFDDYKKITPTICNNNEPQLSKLTVAAIQKIQKFLRDSLASFRKLTDRKQVQRYLARLSYLFQFLFKYSTYIATEVINTYVENSEKYYTNYYKNYTNGLLKMQEDAPSKSDLIGIGTSKLKTLFTGTLIKDKDKESNGANSGSNTSPTSSSKSSINLLNGGIASKRGVDMLTSDVLESPPIEPPQSASFWETAANNITQTVNTATSSASSSSPLPTVKYPFEQIYRSLVYFLMDITMSESKFVSDFFQLGDDMVLTIFTKPINLLIETTENYLSSCYDIVNIILIIGMLYRYRKLMVEKDIAVLNKMFDQLLQSTMNRFGKVFEMILDSFRNISVKDLKPINAQTPHFLMKRYSDYLITLYGVQQFIPSESSGFVGRCAAQLRDSCDRLLQKMSDDVGQQEPKKIVTQSPTIGSTIPIPQTMNQTILLTNNYGFLLQSLMDHKVSLEEQMVKQLQSTVTRLSRRYVDDQITDLKHFNQLIAFTAEWGPLVESQVKIDLATNPSFNITIVEKILNDFEANWKSAVAVIKSNAVKHFEQCTYARSKTFDLLLDILYQNYRLMIIIANQHFPKLKDSPLYKPIQFVQDMRSMTGTSLKFDDIPLE